MIKFKIEQGVPIPDDIRGRGSQYPWGDMKVGDSVFIPMKDNDNATRAKNRLQQSTRTFCKKQENDWKFVLRYRLEDIRAPSHPTLQEISGIRVWRIA